MIAVRAYRGQHCESNSMRTKLGSIAFASKESAAVYARSPNDSRDMVREPKLFAADIVISSPFINQPDDPFLDLSRVIDALGERQARRVALKFAEHIYNTNAWEEFAASTGAKSIEDLEGMPSGSWRNLCFNAYVYLDCPEEVELLRLAGFDGAIHAGSGVTMDEAEYRVFGMGCVSNISVSPL